MIPMRKFCLLLVALLSGVVMLFAEDEALPERQVIGGERSQERLALAERMAQEFFRQKGGTADDWKDADILAELLPLFLKKVSWNPKAYLWGTSNCEDHLMQLLKEEAAKKYPFPSEKEARQLAERRFPLYQRGDRVTVTYLSSPTAPATFRGIFKGRFGNSIVVSERRILLGDMEKIEGNEEEILKFDQKGTEDARKQYIQELRDNVQAQRASFAQEQMEAFRDKVYADATRRNEDNGYVWKEKTGWMTPEDCLRGEIILCHFSWRRNRLQTEGKARLAAQEEAARPLESLRQQVAIRPESQRCLPEEILQKREEHLRQLEAERRAQEEAERRARELAEQERLQRERKEAEKLKKKKQRELQQLKQNLNDKADSERALGTAYETSSLGVAIYVLCGVLVVALIVMLVLQFRKREEQDRFTRFFEGKGKLQKAFWDAAAADPEHFKYVAFLYPTKAHAVAALKELSYFHSNANGELVCTKDLKFGCYSHQGGVVAFVGGTEFRFALWKEAAAVLPEMGGAVYFKESTEPQVKMQLPDISKSGELSVMDLGIEEGKAADGSFLRIYNFQAEKQEDALAFLEKFNVEEEGIAVRISTPSSVLVKDLHGVSEAPAEDFAEDLEKEP